MNCFDQPQGGEGGGMGRRVTSQNPVRRVDKKIISTGECAMVELLRMRLCS